jgi:ribosomal protein S30
MAGASRSLDSKGEALSKHQKTPKLKKNSKFQKKVKKHRFKCRFRGSPRLLVNIQLTVF